MVLPHERQLVSNLPRPPARRDHTHPGAMLVPYSWQCFSVVTEERSYDFAAFTHRDSMHACLALSFLRATRA